MFVQALQYKVSVSLMPKNLAKIQRAFQLPNNNILIF